VSFEGPGKEDLGWPILDPAVGSADYPGFIVVIGFYTGSLFYNYSWIDCKSCNVVLGELIVLGADIVIYI